MSASAKSGYTAFSQPPPDGVLEIQDVVSGYQQTLRLVGELDLCSAPMLDAAVRRICLGGTATAMVLDLGAVTFMDSTGLRTMLGAKTLCGTYGIEFRVLPGPAQVQRLFEITGVQDLLPLATPDGDVS